MSKSLYFFGVQCPHQLNKGIRLDDCLRSLSNLTSVDIANNFLDRWKLKVGIQEFLLMLGARAYIGNMGNKWQVGLKSLKDIHCFSLITELNTHWVTLQNLSPNGRKKYSRKTRLLLS